MPAWPGRWPRRRSARAGRGPAPPPSVIAARLHAMWFSGPVTRLFVAGDALGDVLGDVLSDVLPSLGRLLLGWSTACLVGIVAGVAVGRSARLSEYAGPLIQLGRSIPRPRCCRSSCCRPARGPRCRWPPSCSASRGRC
ncbi:hypothetical protein [Streptosporangium minutum]|uniref:hypothetical protein n=1 Tax=Streptosporangium minutum TaxID=569862 RepID=UPI001F61A7D8|nr:hypothetical protein [Streptosporangium minutum]